MKLKFLTTLITVLLCSQIGNAMLNNDCISDDAFNGSSGKFSRTFKNSKNLVKTNNSKNYKAFKTVSNKKESKNHNAFKTVSNKTENDITISFNEFSDHLLPGQTRIAQLFKESYTMNIGEVDSDTSETWRLNDPGTSNTNTIVLNQMKAEGTEIYDVFGQQGTHVMYSEQHDFYELFDLQDDIDLFFLGSIVAEDGDFIENEYYQSKSPVPLELGLEFSSVVEFEDEDVPGYKIEYTDTYYVVGQGTLETYDDGDADALKMIYQEEAREYQDDVETDYEVRYEIVFYSKKGHYITAEISDPNAEGEVVLENLVYQKLQQKTASVNESKKTITKLYPNPVKSGQDIVIESSISLTGNTVDIFDMSGRKLAKLQLNDESNNQYKVNIPENLSNGLYYYIIKNNKGIVISNDRIQIQ